MRIATTGFIAAAAIVSCLAALPAGANGGQKSGAAPIPILPPNCTGTFSNGVKINVANPYNMLDVGYEPPTGVIAPAKSTVCDVHTFAWNQFIYMTQESADPNNGNQVTPLFLHMAPWYNVLTTGRVPGAYPGGPTDLRTAFLDQSQAGTDGHLLDVKGNTVRYDIRFDPTMYGSITGLQVYTEKLYAGYCKPDPKTGTCANNVKMWLAPAGFNEQPGPGSIEVKTAWRDFGKPGACPQAEYYCNGRFGLVGLHYVNKTSTHGEWIWASFEHVSNDPDCAPGGDENIAPLSPLKTDWAFFDPKTAGASVLKSKTCNVTNNPPQCNANPSGNNKTWVKVNVCRTDMIAGGGASAANCAVNPAKPNNTGNVACLNASLMPQRSGVWKNYKMIGAVWVAGGMSDNQDFRINGFQTQVPGIPFATPSGFTHLADTTMETWLQMGSTGYDKFGTNATQAGCFLCHNQPSAFGQGNKEMNMSHFPGKLPAPRLTALTNSLLRADSTAKAPN